MSDAKKLDPPKQSAGDLAHSTARVLVGLVPGGSVALEFFNNVIAPPIEQRRDQWMEDVAQAIHELQERKGITVEDLRGNESFVSTVAQASAIAVRNHEREKRDALRNAVLNSALPHAPDDSLKQMFLGWVDRFTVWHLRVLAFFDDPPGWFERNNRKYSPGMVSSLSDVLTTAYPDLASRREFMDLLFKDLWTAGLTTTESLHGMMTGHGTVASRTTATAKRFLAFITAPK